MRKYSNIKKIKKGFTLLEVKALTGFTLLEVLVAIFVITVGLIGVITVLQNTMFLRSISSSRLTAAYLAQEGIEIVRNVRDTNWLEAHNKADFTPWDEGFSDCSIGCEIDYADLREEDPVFSPYFGSGRKLKIDSASGFYNYDFGDDTKFARKITIEKDPADLNNVLIITVNVSWEDRGKMYNFPPVQEKLYQWY
jgi:type II secretory pathway pseudopilin PulG